MNRVNKSTKTDCFAYDERKCKALKERYCGFEECKFYKKKSEVEILKHLTRLTRAQKIFLSEKKLKPENWLLVEERTDVLIIYNKISKKQKEVKK